MAVARLDPSTMNALRAAQASARDQARSAVIGRFDAADARRRFSLDQAAEARDDRAAALARTRSEVRDPVPERSAASERRDVQSERRGSTDDARPVSKPRSDTTRPEVPAGRSATERGPTSGAAGEAARSGSTGAPDGSPENAEAAHAETVAAGDARSSIEQVPSIVPGVQPNPTSVSASGLAAAAAASVQNGEPPAGAPETQHTIAVLADPAGQAAGAVGEAGSGEPLQPAAGPSSGPSEAGTSFSAMIEPAETSPSTKAGAAVAPTAKATADADGAAPPVPLGAVPMTIALRSLQNASRFDIRLDPVELGRIDVRLDIDKIAGTVSADLVVDRPATLALLQRDAGALQQALQQAGLDPGAGISLSLRDGSDGAGGERGGDRPRHHNTTSHGAQTHSIADAGMPSPVRSLRLSGLDLRI